ncbi:MAG: RES family NAD+ phosphorylase [Steroidobacteraceae bacterium]
MNLWRIIDRALVREAFSGRDASEYGGRWNSPGTRVVYCSEHPALAALEKLVHIQDIEQLRQSYALISVDCPQELAEGLSEHLPRNWTGDSARARLRRIGDRWIAARRSLALIVPSVVLPRSSNILVNPLHPAFGLLEIGRPDDFDFDPRLRAIAVRRAE